MKKITISCLAMLMITIPAFAVGYKRCVNLTFVNESPDGTIIDGGARGPFTWYANVVTKAGQITNQVEGVSVCAKKPTHAYALYNNVTYASTENEDYDASENMACYCRIVWPAVSKWFYIGYYNSYDYCMDDCSVSCWQHFGTNRGNARKKMIESIPGFYSNPTDLSKSATN